MDPILSKIQSPQDLSKLTLPQLERLAVEMREALCNLVSERPVHFASNLGVVELCLALHTTFDFRHDRLIWDTGHQIYPHKMITGRYPLFSSMRTKGGLMGYPNPDESPYDLFMTGHAGCSVSTMLGIRTADELQGDKDRHAVAVIGDGAFSSGIVYEAMNNAGGMRKKLLVILNDNQMSICPRVGGVSSYFDRLRMNPFYTGLKSEVLKVLNKVPLLGDPVERFLAQMKEAVKAGVHGGMLFEELGFRYLGPIDGHNLALLQKYLAMLKNVEGPVLLHVVTKKGFGFKPAEKDPVKFHTPVPWANKPQHTSALAQHASRTYTQAASEAIYQQMERNERVTVMTAAMCQGNKLEDVRDSFTNRFFDAGICESHTVAFAAGQAKVGLRPIVDIYSTFLQRSFDQLFQEVALQNLPVTFMVDRAGLTGPEGPTHHGVFDLGYMRLLPNMVVMAPGDESELPTMLEFALRHNGPASIRYPKASVDRVQRPKTPIELGRAEILEWATDGMIIACGTLLKNCVEAAQRLRKDGFDVGVINARFIKPLDEETILRAIEAAGFVLTVEEAALAGGFGSAVLETAADAGLDTSRIRRLGVPDEFIQHAGRDELLADLQLDVDGIISVARDSCKKFQIPKRTFASNHDY